MEQQLDATGLDRLELARDLFEALDAAGVLAPVSRSWQSGVPWLAAVDRVVGVVREFDARTT